MEIIFEISKVISPAIIAGLFTIFITKYTYDKNRPLDKLEISYNRVYYPIYRFIQMQNQSNKIDEKVADAKNTLKIYFDKYEKYIDFSTIKTFKRLFECKTIAEKKSAYRKFVENINDMNSYLRKRLGYLEPNILQLYKYTPIKSQITLWIVLLVLGIYLFILLGVMFTGKIKEFFTTMSVLFLFLVFILLIIRFIVFLYYRFKK